MSASGDDQPTRGRWRLVAIRVVTHVLAAIGAVVLAVSLSGCQGLFGGQCPTYRQPPPDRPARIPAVFPCGFRRFGGQRIPGIDRLMTSVDGGSVEAPSNRSG